MARSINKTQSDILIDKMQSNRSIACGFVKLPRETVAEFWNSLTNELNSAGSPVKHVTEWKKVWTDQKRYVRSKAAANIKNQRGTGGGPNQTKSLTAYEQNIYDLIGMKESVEGLPNCVNFGLPDSFCNKENEPMDESIEVFKVSEETVYKQKSPSPQKIIVNKEPTYSSTNKYVSLKRKREEPATKVSATDLIAEELKSHKNLCSKIEEIGSAIQNLNKEMEVMMKRVYRSLEKNNDLKAKKLKELKRHHEVCEELKRKEIKNKMEKYLKIVELEEMKIQIMQVNYKLPCPMSHI